MKVTLVDYTPNAEDKIAFFAAICYNSDTSKDACARRITKLVDSGHLATLRFAYATFLVQGISRVTSHQFVRSKHLDFLQESQRYVKQNETTFTYPKQSEEILQIYDDAYGNAQMLYNQLLEKGVKKEDARFVLPEASHTSLYVTGNFQAWRDFLKLRAEKHAQWEIRECAELIGHELSQIAPNVFGQYERKTTT